jgi:hypothetical protein
MVKRRAGHVESITDLRRALGMMYGNWGHFCAQVRIAFQDRTVPGIVGSCVVMRRAFAEDIGGWDPRVQAADWDLYLRLCQRAQERKDAALPAVAGSVYIHHYVQATRRGERTPFTCTHPTLTVQEKWGEAAIRRWFFDPPLLAPARFMGAPASYLRARALRFEKDVRRTVGAVKVRVCGFPGAEDLLAAVAREGTSR